MTMDEAEKMIAAGGPKTLLEGFDMVECLTENASQNNEIDQVTADIVRTGLLVARTLFGHMASIDESLKSIAASQVIVAKEAEESLQMLEEARGPGESTTPEQASDWRDDTL